MVEESLKREKILRIFHNSLEQWTCRQNEQPLTRWLARELDSSGALSRLPIEDWHLCLEALREARRSRAEWPAHWDEVVGRLVIATLRFSRRTGRRRAISMVVRRSRRPTTILRHWIMAADGTDTARYLRNWQESRKRNVNFTPELAGWDVSRGVLSVLRDQMNGDGDFVAVDHRISGPSCRFELFASGRSWLGPHWTVEADPGAPPRLSPGRGSRFRAPRSRNGRTGSARQRSLSQSFCWAAGGWRSYPRFSRLGPRSRRTRACACLARRRSSQSARGFPRVSAERSESPPVGPSAADRAPLSPL